MFEGINKDFIGSTYFRNRAQYKTKHEENIIIVKQSTLKLYTLINEKKVTHKELTQE